ncbi:hypothetical protein ABZX85_25330 [Streptomyces sp. NPDC004539]
MAGRVIVLDRGRICGQGAFDELVVREGGLPAGLRTLSRDR